MHVHIKNKYFELASIYEQQPAGLTLVKMERNP